MAFQYPTWEQLTYLEQLQSMYSDAHKGAFGFRPRNGGVYAPQTELEYEDAIRKCGDHIDAEQRESQIRSLQCQREFEEEIRDIGYAGAPDRATAIRWWFGANGCTDFSYQQELESTLYGRGFPMGPLWEVILKEVLGDRWCPY